MATSVGSNGSTSTMKFKVGNPSAPSYSPIMRTVAGVEVLPSNTTLMLTYVYFCCCSSVRFFFKLNSNSCSGTRRRGEGEGEGEGEKEGEREGEGEGQEWWGI